MDIFTEKVPILFTIFNRKDISLNSFSQIKKYQPKKLYIAADGPRNESEKLLCTETRRAVCEQIDWNCEVYTLFREKNLGVDKGVYSAISWMFETEQWGVIVEDDCFLSIDFFKFCEEAFKKYEHKHQVVHIGANNIFARENNRNRASFGDFPYSWGWGTWKRAWEGVMDVEMTRWKKYRLSRAISNFGFFRGLMLYYYWGNSYKNRKEIKTWDSIWQFSVMSLNGLCLMTDANLVVNNGIGTSEGTHYKEGDRNFFDYLKLENLNFPIDYPIVESYDIEINQLNNEIFLRLRLFGLKEKIRGIFKNLL